MKIDKTNMGYRKKASAVILNSDNLILLVQLVVYKNNEWNTPGGGIEEGESPEDTILRELEEELGTNKFEIIEKSKIINQYDFPEELIERIILEGNNFRGQEQIQFIVKFTGSDSDIKLQEEEISSYKWVAIEDLKSHLVFPNQWENISSVINDSSLNLNI